MYYTLDKEYFKSLFHILKIRKNTGYNYLIATSIILKYMEVIKELKIKIIMNPGIIGILYFLLLSNVHKG